METNRFLYLGMILLLLTVDFSFVDSKVTNEEITLIMSFVLLNILWCRHNWLWIIELGNCECKK